MKRSTYLAALALCATLFIGSPVSAQTATWIDPAAASQTVDKGGNVVVLDARNVKDYASGHVEGAQSAAWQMFSNMSGKPGDPNYGTLLPAEKLGAVIGGLGIDKATRVLVYSSSPRGAGEDGRIAWTLRSAGITNVAIVDGGYEGWVAAGAKVSQAVSKPQPKSFALAAVDKSMDVSKDQVKASLGRARILDARSPEEYAGAQRAGEPRGGHLPGAISLPWNKVFDAKGRMSSPDTLKKILADAGIKPEDDIIAYCTIGLRSAHLTTVLREMGYGKARNYSASFYEWSGDSALPLEK